MFAPTFRNGFLANMMLKIFVVQKLGIRVLV